MSLGLGIHSLTPQRANSSHFLALGGILLLAMFVRYVIARHYEAKLAPGVLFEFGDSETYWRLGEAIFRGEPYAYGPRQYRVMRTPGYPALLALLMQLKPKAEPWDARLLSVGLGVAAVAMIYVLARSMFDARAGLFASSIAALAPCAVASSVFVLAEAPFIPVMLAQLGLWWAWLKTRSPRRAMCFASLVGILAAIGTLIRPSWLLFTPFALVAAIFAYPKSVNLRELQIAPAMLCLAAMAVVMSPWWFRNYSLSNRFIATTLQTGPSLHDGWRSDADGASDMRFVEDFENQADLEATIPKTGIERELILNDRMSGAAWSWARQNPLRVLQLALVKFIRTWNIVPNFSEMQSLSLRLAVVLGYVPVMITAGLGAWMLRSRTDLLLVCLTPAIYFTLLHMIYVGSIRYRQPAMFPLFILSAAWIATLLSPRRPAKPAEASA
jgi:4-amino-4-deoxy-L-arabinose transferase-like glycosyltransferase